MEFSAPWGTFLKGVSALASGLCVMLAVFLPLPMGVRFLFIFIVVLALFFMVRKYAVVDHKLVITRLGWKTTIDLKGLLSAERDSDVLKTAMRTFGNGGFFSFSGWFYSAKLGKFRAFITDAQNAVVLKWPHRTVVVSPGDPDGFIREVKKNA